MTESNLLFNTFKTEKFKTMLMLTKAPREDGKNSTHVTGILIDKDTTQKQLNETVSLCIDENIISYEQRESHVEFFTINENCFFLSKAILVDSNKQKNIENHSITILDE